MYELIKKPGKPLVKNRNNKITDNYKFFKMTKNILILLIVVLTFGSKTFAQESSYPTFDNPPITPAWAFTPWVWEDSVNTQEASLKLIRLYKEHNIPVGAIILDSPWSTAYNNFEWDKKRYPKPEKMITQMHHDGVKVVMWLTAFINSESTDVPIQKSNDYDFVVKHNYVVDNGRESEWWKGKGVHIDFTNPDAVKWFNKQLDKIMDLDIDGFKLDGGVASLDTYEVETSIGKMRMEQAGKLYYDSVAAYGVRKKPSFVSIARGYSYQGGAISEPQFLQSTFQGDFSGNWSGLQHQINNTYKTALLGFGAPGFEIGGFMEEGSNKAQFIRYMQFASFCPIMENGGSNGAFSSHLPWFHGKDASAIYRYFATLHNELKPYLFSASVDAHLNGGSIIKHPSIQNESHQLGNWLYIKAITSDNNKVDIWLPKKGEWIDYWSGEKFKGGTMLAQRKYDENKYPVFIKSGAIIPLFVENDITGFGNADSKDKQTIVIFPEGKTEYLFHKPLGEGVEYSDIVISVDEAKRTISVKSEKSDNYIFLINTKYLTDDNAKKKTLIKTVSGDFVKINKKGKSFKVKF